MDYVICIIGALKDEISQIKGRMDIYESHSAGFGMAYFGVLHQQRVILVRCGVGRALAKVALEEVLRKYVVSQVVSIGFAGGLVSKLKLGDLVIAEAVREFTSQDIRKEPELLPLDGVLVEKALALRFSSRLARLKGELVTVDRAMCTPTEKLNLGRRFSAMAVDMETSALLRLCIAQNLTFLSVRGISDTVDQELMDFSSCFESSGELSKIKAGWHILTHPLMIPDVYEFRKAIQLSAKNITRFVEEWIKNYR